ncbi:MAG: hypothetical protein WAV90_02425, partial [Gordonia amarae]
RGDGRSDLIGWLARHGIGFDALHFEPRKHLIGCQVYLDDAPHNIEALRGHGRTAVVRHTGYNTGVDGPRVRTAAEFTDLVLSGGLFGP